MSNNKCYYPDWEGGFEVGQHNWDSDNCCIICGEKRELPTPNIEDILPVNNQELKNKIL